MLSVKEQSEEKDKVLLYSGHCDGTLVLWTLTKIEETGKWRAESTLLVSKKTIKLYDEPPSIPTFGY